MGLEGALGSFGEELFLQSLITDCSSILIGEVSFHEGPV